MKGGRPTRAQAKVRRAVRAAESFDSETAPAALERIALMVKDSKTPASVIPQLIATATQLRALLPSGSESGPLPAEVSARLDRMEEILDFLERAVPTEARGRPGLIVLKEASGGA